jgi:hypothetical protein
MKKLFLFLSVAGFAASCQKENLKPVKDKASLATSSTTTVTPTVKHKRIYLAQGGDKGMYANGTRFSYSAGDTLVLKGSWSYCSLENFYGTATSPLVIVNEGSQVKMTNGFALINCRYIKLLGTGTKDQYGFRIATTDNSGVGITIAGRSSNIEVSNVDIAHKTYGYWVKQEASCVDSLQYPNWTIHDINIHNGRIKNVTQEGMYLGSTDPNGTRGITCNGATIYPKPLRLGNITVHHMVIDSTYRSGIQLSGADAGTNEIYSNTVSNCGFEYNTNQGNGISLGGYTHANVHNNNIKNTYALGILVLGAGKLDIENNTITNSGSLGGRTVKGMASIMVDTRKTSPVVYSLVYVKNNTLGANTDVNVRLYRTYATYSTGNLICGNTGTLAVASGIQWSKCN